ncbi:MAG: hypothetical protein QG670_1933 [Thermoproteota archaeon]|nr:hypothetical protein [Thermoproteota archaeon]
MSDDDVFPLRRIRVNGDPSLHSLTTLTNLTTLTTQRDLYVDKFPRQLWDTFKVIAHAQGKTARDFLIQVLAEYVEAHAKEVYSQVNITNIKVEGDVNIYQAIISEEIIGLCKAIKEASQRQSPKPFLNDLRDRLLKTLRQNPQVSPEVAAEVKAALALLRER